MVVGCALMAALALVVERLVPAGVNGVPEEPLVAVDPVTGEGPARA
jgi:hypothetical protein